ncbi:hypothetical protein ETB97_000554 [Aspergillus alliaceus]|uniref:Uncharacterized protein n=1 Tax=Petromyces alliaceus TaxID=209559 RepID=A0A8H6E7R1_PETAA|nr:hypothetical protein ETB97_000554 [Aspergillus burnettii]
MLPFLSDYARLLTQYGLPEDPAMEELNELGEERLTEFASALLALQRRVSLARADLPAGFMQHLRVVLMRCDNLLDEPSSVFFAIMSAPLNSSHPGALVSDSIEKFILEAEACLTEAINYLQAAKNSLQLIGPLSGTPGALLSAQERHSGLVMGYRQLESSVEISREAIESLNTAVGLMSSR